MPNIEIIRSKRKTAALEVTSDCRILVRIPQRFPEGEIASLLSRHSAWLEKALKKRRAAAEKYPELDTEHIKELCLLAKQVLPEKVKYYSALTGLVPSGIKITTARKRFGSCSGKNSICFSCFLMRYPDEAVDYVVLHEIAHIKHHDHGKDFYALIKQYMPDFREREKLLKS